MESGYTTFIKKTFEQIDEKSLNTLRKVAKKRTYPNGTVLCQQGVVEGTFYIIAEGSVVTTQKLENGKNRMIGTLGPNEYFGEMSLLDETPRMFTCATMSKSTTVLEITKTAFEKLVKESPIVAYNIIQHIMENLRRNDSRAIQDLHQKNIALKKAYSDLKDAQDELVEKKKLEVEVELASKLQRNLLPAQLEQYSRYNFAGYLKPAGKIGGDLFDIIDLDKKHLGLLVADVSDKGIQAAMFMAVTKTLFYTEGRRSLSPAAVAESVHQGMMDVSNSFNVFVTAFYGVLHRPSGQLTYIRAGQDPPYHLRPGKPLTRLDGEGRFLGMWEGLQLKEFKVKLASGDRLVLFSDGVTDSLNELEDQFGTERFEAVLIDNQHLSAEDLVNQIVGKIDLWRGQTPPFDDLTLLVVEVK